MFPSKLHHKLYCSAPFRSVGAAFMFDVAGLKLVSNGVSVAEYSVALQRITGKKLTIALAPSLSGCKGVLQEAQRLGIVGLRVWCLELLEGHGGS